jgi:AcrR family transcriptional regulator
VTDSDWRSRRWDATHQRIYDAAMALFHEHGYERVNVGQIAAGAEVSVPTFYAHYPSKDHILMQLPTAEQMAGLLATQGDELPLRDRLERIAPIWFAQWGPEEMEEILTRWRIIASTPSLRTRAAEFERTTAGMIADALPGDASARQADAILINAYLAAFTSALLNWAECNGERKLVDLIDEAFEAVRSR